MFDSEQIVIGHILGDPRCLPKVREQAGTWDFQTEFGRSVFSAACALADARLPVDPVTIRERAAENGTPLAEEDLFRAMELALPADDLSAHIRGMKDGALRSELLEAVQGSQLRLMEGGPPQTVCAELMARLEKLLQKGDLQSVVSGERAILDFMDHRLALESGAKRAFLSTGFTALDNALGGGFVPQSLNILAARPGCGKTTFALQIAEKAAAAGTPTLFLSLEMPNHQLTARRLGVSAGLPPGRLLSGRLDEEENRRMTAAADRLHPAPLYFNRENRAGVSDIGVMARKVKGCGLVVVDYLGLLRYEPGKSLYEQVTRTSNALKQLALGLDVPILCLCQLNRESDKRSGPPRMSDLRDSGAIEQDADSILLLHCPDAPQEEPRSGPETLVCKVGKNRHGPAGRELCFNWYKETGSIVSALHEREKFW